MDMILKKAAADDFSKIRAFYDTVIDETEGMEKHAKWKKGSHPFDDVIEEFIRNGDMYLCFAGEKPVCVMAVPFCQDEEYHQISWGTDAGDNEVATLHIFAVAPEFQGKGFGKAAVKLALEMAREKGMKAFRLDALASNTPAHRLYESLGFEFRGTQNLYTDNAGWTDFYYYEIVFPHA